MGEAKRRRAAEAVLADHARGMRARHRDTVERLYDALAPAGRKLATLEILSNENSPPLATQTMRIGVGSSPEVATASAQFIQGCS